MCSVMSELTTPLDLQTSSVHGIQAIILEWAATSTPGALPGQESNLCLFKSSALGGRILYHYTTWMPIEGRIDTKQVTYYPTGQVFSILLRSEGTQPRGLELNKVDGQHLRVGAEAEALERGWEGRPGGCSSCVHGDSQAAARTYPPVLWL